MSWQNAQGRQRDPEFHRDTNGLVLALEVKLAGRRISFSFNAEGRTKPGRSSEQEAESRRAPRHEGNREQGRRQAAQRVEEASSREGSPVEEASSREGSPVEGVDRRGPGRWRLGRLWARPGRHLAPSRTQAAEVAGRAGTAPDREQENQPSRRHRARHRAGRTETRRAALARTSRAGLAKVRSGLGTAVHAPVQAWQKLRNKPGRAEGKQQGTGFWREVRQLIPSRWAMAMALGVSGTGINLAGAWLGGNSAIAGNLAGIGWAISLQGVLVAAAEVWTSRRFKGKNEPSKTAEQARLDSLELQGREIDERLARVEGRDGPEPVDPSVERGQSAPAPQLSEPSQEQRSPQESHAPVQPESAPETGQPAAVNEERAQQELGGQAPLGAPPTPAQGQAPQAEQNGAQQVDPRQVMAEAVQVRGAALQGVADTTARRDAAQQRADYQASIRAQATVEAQQQEQVRQNATAWAQRYEMEYQQGAPWAKGQAESAWQAARQAEQNRDVHARNAGEAGQLMEAARQEAAGAETERQGFLQTAGNANAMLASLEQQAPQWPQQDPDRVQAPGQVQQGPAVQPHSAGRPQAEERTDHPAANAGFVAPQPVGRRGEPAPAERTPEAAQQTGGRKPGKFADQFRDGRHAVGYNQSGRTASNADRRASTDRDKPGRSGPNRPGQSHDPT